jgi:hypothetical protein
MSESTDRVQQAVREVLALRKLSATTRTITSRAQSRILRSLNEEELTAAALLLVEHGDEGDNA